MRFCGQKLRDNIHAPAFRCEVKRRELACVKGQQNKGSRGSRVLTVLLHNPVVKWDGPVVKAGVLDPT